MKYLITGVSGFVGGHYLEYLFKRHPDAYIIGIDINRPKFNFLKNSSREKVQFYQEALLNKERISEIMRKSKPDYIINLASYSSVAYSWKNVVDCYVNNTNIFLTLVEAMRRAKIKAKILSVGSSEVYGIVDEKKIPLTEKSPLNPANPYAVARVAQEYFSKIYSEDYSLPIISTRSFNHLGPRQKDIFVVSSFAKQIIEAKLGKRERIIVGDLDIIRDFIDVRDVVRAYALLLQKGKLGEVYNICSGRGHRLSEILDMLQELAGTKFPVTVDPGLIRPVDSPVIIGSCEKLEKDTGFQREFILSQSLADILAYWKDRIGKV